MHDERWSAALQSVGFQVRTISCERDHIDAGDLPGAIDTEHPVLAGPMDSATPALVGLKNRLVGLSWGFDLLKMHDRGEDLSWLAQLNAVIVDSTATREIALRSGLDSGSVHTIPWGVDVRLFTDDGPVADRSRWGIPSSAITLVSLRAHEPLYRVADIIAAFALLRESVPEAYLIVGNDGSLRKDLASQVDTLGIADSVTFIGPLPESELPPLLRACDLYVTASEVDGSSVTLLQAMSCGLPVVASDTPGNRGWVQEGDTGQLFTTGSPSDLARVLAESVVGINSTDALRMTINARDRVLAQADWWRNSKALADIMAPGQRGSSKRVAASS